ncbi:hypothetical protein TNCV_1162681 [Trichonephila clavipes]|nr:hypothetical protein TNCV_1162681 [Trichonephila clavipes]
MLFKDQTIKIITSGDLWTMAGSVVSLAIIAGYNHCHKPRYRFKYALEVSLGYSSSCCFHTLPKFIWCSNGWSIPSQSLCRHVSHIFNCRQIGRINMSRKQFYLMGKELLNIAFHLWSPIILLEYG